MTMIDINVVAVEQITPLVKHFTFVRQDGQDLPAFSGGSHVVVSMDINGRVHRNPYSLMGSPEDTGAYHISVLKQSRSRGGSVFMHENVSVGTPLRITFPVNLFSLAKKAHKHVLIAGGIGITPFMSQLFDLERQNAHYELHYACRSREHGAYVELLQARYGNRLHCYFDSEEQRLDVMQLLSNQPLGTHVYICGPQAMVAFVLETARNLGWPEHHIHSEQFTAPPIGDAFKLKLLKSNLEVVVPAEMSMLEAIEGAGVDAPYLCRGGACGRCELEVMNTDGALLLHNDHYLTDTEKASGKKIMTCVSRAKCELLELNI